LAQVDFGRLTGLNKTGSGGTSGNYAQANKALANLSKTKNLQKLLADAEAKRLKLEQLKQGSETDKAQAAAMQWADTLKEADGQRVKDDPAKLRKALKRKVAKKAASQKAWKSRLEQTAVTQQQKQDIRQHNLKARKQGGSIGANLSKKRIVTEEERQGSSGAQQQHQQGSGKEDKGRRLLRPGFEGKRREFLNKKPAATSN